MKQEIKIKLKIVGWIEKIFGKRVCWADCVGWAFGNSWNPFKIGGGKPCRTESKTHCTGACYCGRFWHGEWHKDVDFPIVEPTDRSEIPF